MFTHKKIISGKEMLNLAISNNFAVGAFNFSNMEILQAIVESANEENTPCIIQASESAIQYMGIEYLINMVQAACETTNVPLCLHLDHGKDFDICVKCIDAGFSSVMIDKSSLSFEENIRYTKEVVEYAHKKNVSVEAELGTLSGIEDDVNVSEHESFLTDPLAASEFVTKTNVDSLAIAIGTSHGPNKGKNGSPKLDINRLSQIRKQMRKEFPLVLHGASSVSQELVQKCNQLGANIKGAFGITDHDILEAVKYGVAKVNVDTDIRIAFLCGILESIHSNPSNIDPRKYNKNAKEIAKSVIKSKIRLLKNT